MICARARVQFPRAAAWTRLLVHGTARAATARKRTQVQAQPPHGASPRFGAAQQHQHAANRKADRSLSPQIYSYGRCPTQLATKHTPRVQL
eukprot:6184484-Pleurochrysis_carterae.AAC.4